MLRAASSQAVPRSPAVLRICSGACPYFEAQYEQGRKVAGIGHCGKHQSDRLVQVGTPCVWPNGRRSEALSAIGRS